MRSKVGPSRRVWRVEVATGKSSREVRASLEELIRRRYAAAYGAEVTHFHPTLLGLATSERIFVGAIGSSPARDSQRLFLEQYLDTPIESAIALAVGHAVPRGSIQEVGNLAGTMAGAGPALITGLAEYLGEGNTEWVVFTATEPLQVSLIKLGVELFDLGGADPARLGAERLSWGTYYDSNPRLTAAFLPQLHDAIIGSRLEARLGGVWEDARRQGAAQRLAS